MRHITLALLAAGTTIAALPAAAQDTNPVFTGPRVEATIGYDHVGAGSSISNNNGRDDQSIDGFLYGGGIGYDAAFGRALIGAEAELTDSTARSSRRDLTGNFGFGRVDQGRDIYVGGRIGTLLSPTTMVYAKGGYTNSRLNVLAGTSTQSTDNHFDLDGWRLGAGVEHAVGPNSYAKVEYRYSNYNDARLDYASGASTGRFDVDTDRHQIVASYGFRF